jgi:hypothetical protein
LIERTVLEGDGFAGSERCVIEDIVEAFVIVSK